MLQNGTQMLQDDTQVLQNDTQMLQNDTQRVLPSQPQYLSLVTLLPVSVVGHAFTSICR